MNQKTIGVFIAKCRKEKGLTQKELATKLNVSDKSISKWERGVCLPDVSLFVPLCEILGVDLNELFFREKKEDTSKEKVEEVLMSIIKNQQRMTTIKR